MQALNDLAWIYTDARHDHAKALELANKGVKLDPDSPHLRDTRGVALTNLGKHKEAQDDFRRAVEILRERPGSDPDLARALLQLARCQVRLKSTAAARSSASEALEIDKKKNVLTTDERTEIAGILAGSAPEKQK